MTQEDLRIYRERLANLFAHGLEDDEVMDSSPDLTRLDLIAIIRDLMYARRPDNDAIGIRSIRCALAGFNAQGEPDFWFVTIRATTEEIERGAHLLNAEMAAKNDNFEPHMAYDEDDEAGRILLDHCEWATMSTVTTPIACNREKSI